MAAISFPTTTITNSDHLVQVAEKETHPTWRVKAFCQAAISYIQESKKEKATAALDKIRTEVKEMPSNYKNDALCRIAKVRLLINPGVVPNELIQAKNQEEKAFSKDMDPSRSTYLGIIHVKPLCQLAKRYNEAGDKNKAIELIEKAKKGASCERKSWEYLRGLLCIAKAERYIGLSEGVLTTLDKALKAMWDLDQKPKITMWLSIAELILPIDAKKAHEVLLLAEGAIKKYPAKELSNELKKIEALFSEWKKLTNS